MSNCTSLLLLQYMGMIDYRDEPNKAEHMGDCTLHLQSCTPGDIAIPRCNTAHLACKVLPNQTLEQT